MGSINRDPTWDQVQNSRFVQKLSQQAARASGKTADRAQCHLCAVSLKAKLREAHVRLRKHGGATGSYQVGDLRKMDSIYGSMAYVSCGFASGSAGAM